MRLHSLALAAATVLGSALSLAPRPSAAATPENLTASGNWSNAGVWSGGAVPNNTASTQYDATVGAARTATLDVDARVNNLNVGGSSSGYSTVTLGSGRSLTVDGSFSAGLYTTINGSGTLNLSGLLGSSSGSASNAALLLDGITLNNQAASTFSDGGANFAFSTGLAHGAVVNNAGTWNLNGASSYLYASTGGGSFVNTGSLRGSGNVYVPVTSSGSIVAAANSAVGSVGLLSFNAGGSSTGTLNTGSTVYQGTEFSSGNWNFAAGSVNAGAGVFRVIGAAVTIAGAHNVTGQTQVGSGSLTFTNAGQALAGVLYLYGGSTGFKGANAVTQLNLGNPGAASGSPTAVLNLGQDGQLGVTGAFNPATYSKVNGSGSAAITVQGGGSIASNAAMILDGVSLNNTAGSTLTQDNAGGFDVTLQNGAVVNNAGSWLLRNQNGRGLVAGSGAAGAGAAFNNTGVLWANVSYTSATIGMALNNSGTVRLDTGAGGGGNPSLTVGSFLQTAGATQLAHDNGNFATLASSNPLQFKGGSLSGSGRLIGAVQVSGDQTLVSPGYSIGQLNVTGSYAQTGGVLKLEIGRSGAGTGTAVNDKLSSTGLLAITNAVIEFSLLAGSQDLQVGDSFTVLSSSSGGLSLSNDSLVFDGALAGYTFTRTQTASGYTLTLAAPVPEPASSSMALLGAAALFSWRRLRRLNPRAA